MIRAWTTPWAEPLRRRVAQARAAFDARPHRERLLIAAALGALVLLLADATWIEPARRQWNQVRAQQRQASQQLAAAAAERARLAGGAADAAQQTEADIRSTQDRLARLERELREQAGGLVPADRMVDALEQMLASQPRVRVRSMRSLPRADLLNPTGPGATAAAASAAVASPEPVAALYRHGVEVTLEGSYVDLVDYLRSLDHHPQQLVAGGLQFRVEKHPLSTLTLRLYTLSMDRHWLEI